MDINIFRRHECQEAKGLCVVIDVLRAFTTAAYCFAAGVKEITLVSSAEEALQMHKEDASLILMGEQDGAPIKGFHYGNSPAAIMKASLFGRRVVQRTSCGTQGVVACRHADQLMIASFVVADSTLEHIEYLSPKQVSFIVTGTHNGDEDLAFAEYMKHRLSKKNVSLLPFLDRVRNSPEGRIFADPNVLEFSKEDLELAVQANRFSFAMEVEKHDGKLVAKQVKRAVPALGIITATA